MQWILLALLWVIYYITVFFNDNGSWNLSKVPNVMNLHLRAKMHVQSHEKNFVLTGLHNPPVCRGLGGQNILVMIISSFPVFHFFFATSSNL